MNKLSTRLSTLAVAMSCAMSGWADDPFKVTTIENGQFAANTTWYTLTIGGNMRISNNGNSEYIRLGGALTGADGDLWCVVKDGEGAYKFYNKEGGTTKSLIAPTEMKGTTGGGSYAIVGSLEGKTGYTDSWQVTPSTAANLTHGFFINEKGHTNNKLNNRDGKLAFWTGGADAGSTIVFSAINTSFTVNMSTGTFTKSNPAKTYASEWKSTATNPQLTVSTEQNDFGKTADNGNLVIYSGGDGNNNVTLSAGVGYKVTGYSITFKNKTAGTASPEKFTIAGKEYTATDEAQTVTVKDLDEVSTTFSTKGSNKGAEITNLTVQVVRSFAQVEAQQDIFIYDSSVPRPYRIPAIACAANGDLIAISDYRPCGNDIGYGEVDVKCRISQDNGKTWGKEFFLANGMGDNNGGEVWKTGFGDAAVVADAERNEVLVMMVCGKTVCHNGNYIPDDPASNPNRVARVRGTYDEATKQWKWTAPEEVTESVYRIFVDENNKPTVQSLFIGSGRICQSRVIKVKDYYRLYCSTWTKNGGNRVIYSDDFGATWHVLGTLADRPAPGGDEPKCEELPDGTVVLSSRMRGGRFFNYYTYTDVAKGTGTWGTVAASVADNKGTIAVDNSTNGEIMILPVVRNSDKAEMYLALQSVPLGPGRSNVGVYYKELASLEDLKDPATFAANWDGKHQVSYIGSCYSTMAWQKNDTLAFFYEEETYGRGYTSVYKQYTIDYLTKGAYSYKKDVNRDAYVTKIFAERVQDVKQMEGGEAVGMMDASKMDQITDELDGLVEAYKKDLSAQGYANVISQMDKVLGQAVITIDPAKLYTIQNKGRQGKTFLSLGTTLDNQHQKYATYTAVEEATSADQKFNFVPTGEGTYKVYNQGAQTYMSPTQPTYKHVYQVSTADSAGVYTVTSTREGWSVLSNPGNSQFPAIHLSGENMLVEWSASEPASQWKIVPVDGEVTAIDAVVSPAPVVKELKYYDLQGRQLQGAPKQGIYITSDKKKHIAR